jgi:hypothetical protein
VEERCQDGSGEEGCKFGEDFVGALGGDLTQGETEGGGLGGRGSWHVLRCFALLLIGVELGNYYYHPPMVKNSCVEPLFPMSNL